MATGKQLESTNKWLRYVNQQMQPFLFSLADTQLT